MSTQGHESEAINVSGLKASLKKGGNIGIYNEAICSTAGGTAAKVTNTTPPSFTLTAGAKILVKFTYAISAENATLQVGSNTAKPIYYKGAALPADIVKAGTSVLLQYDGTSFNIIGDLNTDTTYSVMGASGSTHASGLVPDTPSVAGTTKFLREDGTWQEVSAAPEVQIGGNTPSSESDIKLFVDESADDTVEVYTKAQADGQFVAVVNMNTEPTESTLTYTATDGTTKSFKTGDEIRVSDQDAENGYTFYKLYALTTEEGVTTAVWDKLGAGGGSAAGLEIVEASGTTLNAEVGKYYRYDSDVTTLAVTLPTITGATEVQEFKMYFHTASSGVSVSFTGGTIKKLGNFNIISNNTYEVNCTWTGNKWTLHANGSLPYNSEIEYLESTGTQYIDTKFYPNGATTKIEVDYAGVQDQLFCTGCRENYFTNAFFFANGGGESSEYGTWYLNYNSGYLTPNNYPNDNNRHVLSASNTIVFDNSTIATFGSSSFDSSYSLYIFAANFANTPHYGKYKVYSYKIYNGVTLVRDFIPVRIDQTGYMYDKITGQLFGNSGTGSFTLGPDI